MEQETYIVKQVRTFFENFNCVSAVLFVQLLVEVAEFGRFEAIRDLRLNFLSVGSKLLLHFLLFLAAHFLIAFFLSFHYCCFVYL